MAGGPPRGAGAGSRRGRCTFVCGGRRVMAVWRGLPCVHVVHGCDDMVRTLLWQAHLRQESCLLPSTATGSTCATACGCALWLVPAADTD